MKNYPACNVFNFVLIIVFQMPGGGMGMQQGVRPGMPMEQDSQMVKMLSAFLYLQDTFRAFSSNFG